MLAGGIGNREAVVMRGGEAVIDAARLLRNVTGGVVIAAIASDNPLALLAAQ